MNSIQFNDADLNLIKVLDALVRDMSVARRGGSALRLRPLVTR
jgi:hypothetical protein